MLEVSSSLCPPQADISVSAFATNIFGNGHLSDSLHIGEYYANNKCLCSLLLYEAI